MTARLSLISTSIAFLLCGSALADPGDPDGSFDGSTLRTDSAAAIAPARGTNFVVAGEIGGSLTAELLDRQGNSIDSFGDSGRAAAPVGDSFSASALSTIVMPNGKVVVGGSTIVTEAGKSARRAALVRFDSRGRLDTGFGDNGRLILDLGGADSAAAGLALAPGGKLLISGHEDTAYDSDTYSSASRMVLARITASGRLDTNFATGGIARVTPAGAAAAGFDLKRLRSGRVLVTGFVKRGSRTHMLVARFGSSGGLDRAFGSAGFAEVNARRGGFADSGVTGLAVTGSGRIVLAGFASDDADDTLTVLARLTAGGRLDRSFGTRGLARFAISELDGGPAGIALQRDGKIVLAGDLQTDSTDGSDYAVRRYTAAGRRDRTFGAGGLSLADGGNEGDDFGAGVLIQRNGRIVVAGTTSTEEDRLDFSEMSGSVARFEGGTRLVAIGRGPFSAGPRSAAILLRCLPEARGGCRGTLRLRTTSEVRLVKGGKAALRTLGSVTFALRRGQTATLQVPLTSAGRIITGRSRQTSTRAIASVRDLRGASGLIRKVVVVA
jgi:uncharacterized delta-60 repeat protein